MDMVKHLSTQYSVKIVCHCIAMHAAGKLSEDVICKIDI